MQDFKTRLAALLVSAVAALTAGPLNASFESDLRAALALHDAASSLEAQAEALVAFRQVTERHPGQWLGHFWTAYEETQIHMLHSRQQTGDDLGAYLDRAQAHLDKARHLATEATPRERSSLAALQSLIYSFRSRFDAAQHETWRQRRRASLFESAKLDPDNPVLLVFIATELTGQARREESWRPLVAARALFIQAQRQADDIADRSQTTFFNAEWIQFWLPSAQGMLEAFSGTP